MSDQLNPTSGTDEEFERRVQQEVERRERDKAEREQREAEARKQDVRAYADRWPEKGYDGPAPWDIAAAHEEQQHRLERDPNTNEPKRPPRPYAGPAAVTHSHPILSEGADGPAVAELVALLAELGYDDNTVARGRGTILDNTVMGDVHRFCADYGVGNGIGEFGSLEVPAAKLVDQFVGPYIWQALETVAAAKRDGLVGAEA